MGVIGQTSTSMRSNDEIFYGADGRGYMNVYASEDLTAKTPYAIMWDEYGTFAIAIASDNESYIVGVPEKSWDSGTVARLYVKGLVEDVITASLAITAGHAVGISSGAVTDIAADYTGGATEWGVCVTTTGSASTTQDIFLTGHLITAG